ncbi:MAG: hypothetical protein WAO55_10785 [Candidatus Manganitrophaceae bacterium]
MNSSPIRLTATPIGLLKRAVLPDPFSFPGCPDPARVETIHGEGPALSWKEEVSWIE